jgi:hypothetical protein
MVLVSEELRTLQTRTLGTGKRDLTFDPQTWPEQEKKLILLKEIYVVNNSNLLLVCQDKVRCCNLATALMLFRVLWQADKVSASWWQSIRFSRRTRLQRFFRLGFVGIPSNCLVKWTGIWITQMWVVCAPSIFNGTEFSTTSFISTLTGRWKIQSKGRNWREQFIWKSS